MTTIGIAVTRDNLHAVVLDGAPPSPQVVAAVSVPCREPFGGPEDPASLAAELRGAVPGGVLPGAVITMPPPLTYLRQARLPVSDLSRARAIHLAELEGNLPIEDSEILSDLLPASPESPDTFVAVASTRSLVERTVEAFQAAGIRVDLVVTDHAALLCAAYGKVTGEVLLLAAVPDILLMKVSGGGVGAARQFPAALADTPPEILSAAGEMSGGNAPAFSVGELPPSLAGAVPGISPIPLPAEVPASHLSAYGAALAPFLPKAAGGFSLRTSAEAAADRLRASRRMRVAAAAAAVAAVLAVGALQVSVWTSAGKVAKARAQVRKEFSEAAPDVRLREATAGVQIREKLASVRRLQKELGTDAPPVVELLSAASGALPPGQISMREASVEGGRMRLVGEAKEPGLVETYRAALSSAFGRDYAVTLQGSEGSAAGAAVKFTILVEKREAQRAS